MTRNSLALRRHPHMASRSRLAVGLVLQEVFCTVSRVLDSGRFSTGMINVNAFELALPNLPTAFDGYRMVHISDIHMGTWMNGLRLEGIVEMINALGPDLVAITGDFISYTVDDTLDKLVVPLSGLSPADGVFAVMGNHDVWTDPEQVRETLAEANVIELQNTCVSIRRDGELLNIAGVDNVYDRLADLDAVLTQLPDSGASILLAHEPDFADKASATGRFDLQLSGHSHGGQINLPLIGPPFLPHLGKKYPRGLYRVGQMQLYTSRGLGTTSLQVRVRCMPEIGLITLRRPK